MVAIFLLSAGRQPEFVRKYPVATKRVVRAVLKAADFAPAIRREPPGVSSMAVSPLATSMPYRQCETSRMTNGESTIQRTHCASTRCDFMNSASIKSTPQKVIAEGTDWRFLNELKRELKTLEDMKRPGSFGGARIVDLLLAAGGRCLLPLHRRRPTRTVTTSGCR